ncbi:MAG: anthrax toxin-like adenylyl cyclase domain-containing protein [Vibrionaceae bacterium]
MSPSRAVLASKPVFITFDEHRFRKPEAAKALPIKKVHASNRRPATFAPKMVKRLTLSIFLFAQIQGYRSKQKQKTRLLFSRSRNDVADKNARSAAHLRKENNALDSIFSWAGEAPAPVFDDGNFAPVDELISPFSHAALLYSNAIQAIADSYQVIIEMRPPCQATQHLLARNIPTATFDSLLSVSQFGPTAGFFTVNASYTHASQLKCQEHDALLKQLVSKNLAKVVNLQLSAADLKKALSRGRLTQTQPNLYAAIYHGRQIPFSISARDNLLYDTIAQQYVKVLADQNGNSELPVTQSYQISHVIARDNTPAQTVARKGQLNDVVVRAVNQKAFELGYTGGDLVRISDDKLHFGSSLQKQNRAIFFLPKQTPQQALTQEDHKILYTEFMRKGYMVTEQ